MEMRKAIQGGGKKGLIPKAIIPVDLFGLPAGRYRLIKDLAKEARLNDHRRCSSRFWRSKLEEKTGCFE